MSSAKTNKKVKRGSYFIKFFSADDISWFAVFDGHAGSRVSAHCSTHLLESISTFDDFKDALKKEHQLSEEELMEKVSYNSYLENRCCGFASLYSTIE